MAGTIVAGDPARPKRKLRRAARYAGWTLLTLLILLALYETFAVMRAQARTPAVLARAAARPLKLESIPRRRLAMLLRVEDPGFFDHRGVDFSTPGQGMTTMTQALVKIFYFGDFQPGFAKLEQSLIARLVLTPAMSKRDQLETFVNFARFGHFRGREVTGFAAAAQSFFGRPLDQLSDREFLGLVAMLIAPNALDPRRHPEANAERVRRIEAMLAGRCAPQGLRDIRYDACG